MNLTEDKYAFLLKTISILIFVSGIVLTAFTAARLGHAPFPFSHIKILKIILGGSLALMGWTMGSPKRRELMYHSLGAIGPDLRTLASVLYNVVLPPRDQDGYSRFLRTFLTLIMFTGLSMVIWALINPPVHFAAQFLQRRHVIGLGGIALTLTSGILRQGKKAKQSRDWLKPMEILCLFCLALAVTAIDMYFSSKIGLAAYPPYQDGVTYMLEAKKAFPQLGLWKVHPVTFANMTFGNRYPLWQALIVLNFKLFGEGEWQCYATRFWPTLIILLAVFWMARRRLSISGAWAAAILTSLLPTLSVNLQVAAAGSDSVTRAYLSDLRPDLLFAAFLLCAVVFLVEHGRTLDEPTALLSGCCAALAVLTKGSAVAALLLAWGIAAMYALIVNRRNLLNVLFMAAWALLVFTALLLPWALAGGAALTFGYIKNVMTVELPLYSNPHATLKTELTYYWNLFALHMGLLGVILLVAGFALFLSLILLTRKKQSELNLAPLFTYLLTGVALYGLISISLAKNFFLGLPCYLILWVFSLSSLAAGVNLLRAWKTRFSYVFISAGLLYAGFLGIGGYRNLLQWPSQELRDGPYNRSVMRQIAGDLSEILSNADTFMWMPGYGNPATLLYYMPQGKLPQAIGMDAMTDPPPEEYVRKFIEPAKVVLLLRGDIEKFNSSGLGYVHPANYPYFRAIAAWVRRPGSSHFLLKTYHFFGDENNPELTVDLYMKNAPKSARQEQKAEKPRRLRTLGGLNAQDK